MIRRDVHCSSVLNQKTYAVETPCGQNERCGAGLVRGVHVRPFLQEKTERLHGAVSRRVKQRRCLQTVTNVGRVARRHELA